MAAGVEQLKQRYGLEIQAHRQLGDAVRPYMEDIRRAGVDPHIGVQRLLQWHRDLQSNPAQSMVRLMAMFGLDPRQPLVGGGPQQPAQQQVTGVPDEIKPLVEAINPYFQQQINPFSDQLNQVNQRLAAWEQQNAQSKQRQTETQVERWGDDKPYFAAVRPLMREILIGADQSGTAGRFLDRYGEVDLDKLYGEAVWQHPEVRQRIQQEQRDYEHQQAQQAAAQQAAQQAAEEKRVQDQRRAEADRARRASASVRPGAPGTTPQRRPGEQKAPTSVRDSIVQAMQQVNENRGARV
jgi:hypothetical protein